jgi:hypothetical protein
MTMTMTMTVTMTVTMTATMTAATTAAIAATRGVPPSTQTCSSKFAGSNQLVNASPPSTTMLAPVT